MKAINQLIDVLIRHRDQHQEQARKLGQAIEALQKLCPHDEMRWVGNRHNCDIYRCNQCQLEFTE